MIFRHHVPICFDPVIVIIALNTPTVAVRVASHITCLIARTYSNPTFVLAAAASASTIGLVANTNLKAKKYVMICSGSIEVVVKTKSVDMTANHASTLGPRRHGSISRKGVKLHLHLTLASIKCIFNISYGS